MKSGYSVDIVYMAIGIKSAYITLDMENLLQKQFFSFSYIPKIKFGGYTECFKTIDLHKFKEILDTIYYTSFIENLPIDWRN